jgi:hypothetical protein
MGSFRKGARFFFVFSQEEGLVSGRGCPWHLYLSLSFAFSTWTVSIGKRKSVLLLIVWDTVDD